MQNNIAAIPTMYKGVQFRSRLEAKWAAVFDRLDWKWTYEPCDYNGWIPDFVLHLQKPVLVEIKPCMSKEELRKHTSKIDHALPSMEDTTPEILLLGTGMLPCDQGYMVDNDGLWCLGLLRQPTGPDGNARDGESHDWDAAQSFKCTHCSRLSFFHGTFSYCCRVCGEHQKQACSDHDYEWLEVVRSASNDTQWRSPRRAVRK